MCINQITLKIGNRMSTIARSVSTSSNPHKTIYYTPYTKLYSNSNILSSKEKKENSSILTKQSTTK